MPQAAKPSAIDTAKSRSVNHDRQETKPFLIVNTIPSSLNHDRSFKTALTCVNHLGLQATTTSKAIKINTKIIATINKSMRLIAREARAKTTIRSNALSYTNAPNEISCGTPTFVKYRSLINSPTFPGVAVNANPAI